MEKLHEYQGLTGRLHQLRDNIKEKFSNQENPGNFLTKVKTTALDQLKGNASANVDYSHIYRWENPKRIRKLHLNNLLCTKCMNTTILLNV